MTRPDTAPRTQAEADALHANAMATVSTALLILETVAPDLRRLVANADFVMGAGAILHPDVFLTLTSAKGDSARRQVALAKAALAFVDCAREQFPLPGPALKDRPSSGQPPAVAGADDAEIERRLDAFLDIPAVRP